MSKQSQLLISASKKLKIDLLNSAGLILRLHDPNLYESLTGKKAKKPVLLLSKPKAEVKKIDTRSDELDAYQKKCQAEIQAQLEKEREELKNI